MLVGKRNGKNRLADLIVDGRVTNLKTREETGC